MWEPALKQDFDSLTYGQVLSLWLEIYDGRRSRNQILDIVMPNGLKLLDCPAGYVRDFSDWLDHFMGTVNAKLLNDYSATREIERRNRLANEPNTGIGQMTGELITLS
jgi:hypothetical protein